MVTETRNINNFDEVIQKAEITCQNLSELEYYVKESAVLIEERQKSLLNMSPSTELYYVKRNIDICDEDEDYENDSEYPVEAILIYDQFDVLFTSEDQAKRFMDSYMDISMKSVCEVCKIETLSELVYRLSEGSILGDDLIIKRIEFKSEDDVWHCEDLIYDPKREYKYIPEN